MERLVKKTREKEEDLLAAVAKVSVAWGREHATASDLSFNQLGRCGLHHHNRKLYTLFSWETEYRLNFASVPEILMTVLGRSYISHPTPFKVTWLFNFKCGVKNASLAVQSET